ncbi:DUF1364 family protein [Psychrosphaera sp. 1_MG-2023]|uniref:nuclease domain-containing protein n=1 Tax=Psychrosphaera sp. 1_MG-2023 TaxID=3062643 RepID=UPI0026E3DB05|nr:nuclease domain-containing protein [Psychrosphaera sp. 1_MG-2023]MDO6718832.1 DUF1364 family protein [Psychrosphaera sp. 1_MG-2023]
MAENLIAGTVSEIDKLAGGPLSLTVVVDEDYVQVARTLLSGNRVPVVVARLMNQPDEKWVAQEQKPGGKLRVVSKKLRESARGRECQIRIPGVCNYDTDTTVLAHVGKNSGMGMKAHDIESAHGCSDCHGVLDGQIQSRFSNQELRLFGYEAAERTRAIFLELDLLRVKK